MQINVIIVLDTNRVIIINDYLRQKRDIHT